MPYSKKASGISTTKVPAILSYPEIPFLKDRKELHSQYVYIIERYPEEGLAVLVFKDGENICVRIGDFQGNVLDPSDPKSPHSDLILEFWREIMPNLMATLTVMGVEQSILYFSNDDGLRLVDFRLSLNKFTGPGYIRDIFSKQMRAQEVVKIIQLDDSLVENIIEGNGSYDGEYVIKPSKFKFTLAGDDVIPMYGKVIR